MKQKHILFIVLFTFSITLGTSQIVPDTMALKKFYKIGKNNDIFMPLGKISFADSIISFKKGKPVGRKEYLNARNALGEPNFVDYLKKPTYVSLGCGGQLTVEFKDNGFIDIDGTDLYIFEVGPSVEPFQVEISADGKNWINLGKIGGGSSNIDIADTVKDDTQKEIYYFVRITDLKGFCRGPTPGSDIDAIGTIGGVLKINVQANLLFDTDKYTLRETSVASLEKLKKQLTQIPNAEILIEGHTDSDASEAYNQTLAKNRAIAVRHYLSDLLKDVGTYTYTVRSYGETKPIADNNTEAGKQKNRRVEIIVIPDKDFYKPPRKK